MSKVDSYRLELAQLPPGAWPAWLAARSNLPGPRANLELAAGAAEEADDATALALAGDGDEFVRVCGVVALGRNGVLDPVLAKGLANAWSVVAPADLERVGPAMEQRLGSEHPVVRRALREEIRKARLQRLDPVWAGRWGA